MNSTHRAKGPSPRSAAGFIALLTLCLPFIGGCVTATVQQVREASTGLADAESIVVWPTACSNWVCAIWSGSTAPPSEPIPPGP